MPVQLTAFIYTILVTFNSLNIKFLIFVVIKIKRQEFEVEKLIYHWAKVQTIHLENTIHRQK